MNWSVGKIALFDSGLQVAKRIGERYHYGSAATLREGDLSCTVVLDGSRPLPPRVLLFKPDELGDAVHSLPALKLLREQHPNSKFTLLCTPLTAPLFAASGLVDEIVELKVRRWGLRFVRVDWGNSVGLGKPFDVAIFLRSYPGFYQDFLRLPAHHFVVPADPRLPGEGPCFTRPEIDLWPQRRHQVVQMAQILSPYLRANRDLASGYPDLQWKNADTEALALTFGAQLPAAYTVVHPYGKFVTRTCPEEIVRRDVAEVSSFGPVVSIGSHADGNFFPAAQAIGMEGRLTLMQSAYLISRAQRFLGNLSGPAHLAAMLGVNTRVWMGGHSLQSEWRPLGRQVETLRRETGCTPCHRFSCPAYLNRRCFDF